MLCAAIQRFLNGWNEEAHALSWIKTADASRPPPARKPMARRGPLQLASSALVTDSQPGSMVVNR